MWDNYMVHYTRKRGIPVIDALMNFDSGVTLNVIRVHSDWHQRTGLSVDDFIKKIAGYHQYHAANKAVKEAKAGRIEYRVDKAGIIHAPIGKRSFTAEQLEENARTLYRELVRVKPSAVKGT